MVTEDRAPTTKDGKWKLYESLNGGPNAEKNVVIVNTEMWNDISISIQREEFVGMVKRYFDIKGY
jgi:hypothetical protein